MLLLIYTIIRQDTGLATYTGKGSINEKLTLDVRPCDTSNGKGKNQ